MKISHGGTEDTELERNMRRNMGIVLFFTIDYSVVTLSGKELVFNFNLIP